MPLASTPRHYPGPPTQGYPWLEVVHRGEEAWSMATNWGPYPRHSFPRATRRAILRRDGQCQWCGSEDRLEADHVVSFAEATRQGWSLAQIDHESNGQALCHDCHLRKTRQEQGQGRQRKRDLARRPVEPHPGLLHRGVNVAARGGGVPPPGR